MAKLILPIQRDTDFNGTARRVFALELQHDNDRLYFECTAENGGLITAFARNGLNVLTGPEINPHCFGSTFWTSPQSDWDWPPPPELDVVNWEVRADESTGQIELTSPVIPSLGLQIIKRFSPATDQLAIRLGYTILNVGSAPTRIAHWEISRVAPGGLTFFPRGEGDITCGPKRPLPISESDEIVWFQHDAQITDHHKLFSDGAEGWIAHLSDDLLFIKTYPDEPAHRAAPDEAEIEIYAAPGYVEVEQQGPYLNLVVGDSRTWSVIWTLRKLSGVAHATDYRALLQLARSAKARSGD